MGHKIKIYSLPACPHCIAAKEFLEERKIDFEDVNVKDNDKAVEEVVKKSGQYGVPVIEIRKNHGVGIVVGFDKEKIEKLIDGNNK